MKRTGDADLARARLRATQKLLAEVEQYLSGMKIVTPGLPFGSGTMTKHSRGPP